MTADDDSAERSQRTVAELLAQYGEGAPATGRRRSRRRTEDTGAHPAADPSPEQHAGSGSNGAPPESDPPATGPPTSPPTDLFEAGSPADPPGSDQRSPGAPPPVGQPPVGQPPVGQLPVGQPPPQVTQVPPQGAPQAGIPRPAAPPRRDLPPAYPPDADPVATAKTAPWFPQQPDPPTDQLPRYIPEGPVHTNGRSLHDGPHAQHSEPGEPTAAGIALDDLDPRDASAFGPDFESDRSDVPPTQAGRPDREPLEVSPTTAWLAMVAQWIGGAIGGAALWVAFRYLWTAMPIVALVAAVLVIGGLVLLVRAIRRSDDLKTTVFAVLVGLVVTVSPAVLVLVTR